MNAQVRSEIAKTKKLISSQQNNARTNNKQDTKVKPAVAYDYDAAVSQPDVPNFLGQKYNNSLPIRKKGFYSRGKSKLSIRKTVQATSEDSSASNTKYQDKEANELQTEEGRYSKVSLDSPNEEGYVKEELAKKEITPRNNEPTPILSKGDVLKNDTQEKDRQKPNSDQRNKIENIENIGNVTPRSNSLQKKDSRIPRTKAVTSSGVIQVPRNDSMRRFSVTTPKKSFDTIANRKDVKREGFKKQIQSKIVTSKQQNLDPQKTDRHQRIDETIITETTPAVIGSASDPSTFVVLKDLNQNHENQSCDNCMNETSSQLNDRMDTLSDSRSSPERVYVRKKWRRSLKHRKYIDTSSDDFDVSSDYSSQSNEKKILKNSVAPFIKSSSMVKSSSRAKNRRGSSFSFFNTLFDIVFWPFLFLKSDR